MLNPSSFSSKNIVNLCLLFLFISVSLFEKAYAVYCVPSNPTCSASSYINNVSIGGTTFNNATMACNSFNAAAYSIFAPSSTTTASLQPGNTYQVSVNCFGASIISLWIDYNQNQVFEASEWTQVATASASNVTSTVSIAIPFTASSGTTGMRVRSRISTSLNGPTDACTAFGSGEAEDYTVNIANTAPCVAPPVAGTTISTANPVCSNVPFTLSLSGASTGSGLSYQWQISANNSTWLAISGATSSSLIHTITASSYLRCAVICSGQVSYSTSLYVSLNSPTQCYCSSAPIYNTLSDIGQVSIGSMSNGSAGIVTSNSSAINSYTDFTGGSIVVTSLDRGATYPMIVQQVTSGTQVNIATVVVYIDYNQDGVFSYPSEFTLLGSTTNASGSNVVVNSVSIPASASLGNTRMRVILSEGSNPTQQACGTYFFGETEDYLVNIVAPQNCAPTFVAGTTFSSSPSVCGNVPFSLYTVGSTSNSAVTFQWQYSLNNINWTNVVIGGTQAIYTTSQSQSTYYRCALTCNGSTLYSTVTYVSHTPLQNCYCTSAATTGTFTDIGNVSIGALNNGIAQPVFNNSTAVSSYTNFTALGATTLNIGTQYPITVSQILSTSGFYSAFGIVFIDYNQDGSFSSTEALFLGTTTNTSGGTQLSGIVTVPTNAIPGITRMRVILVENGNGLQSACGNYAYGETEDYLVDLTVGQACVFPPTAGIAISNISQVCSNTLFTLNLSGNSTGSGQTYTWQSSSNNSSWNNISAANNYPNLNYTQTQSTYYRCMVNCGGFIAYSSSIFILQNGVNACYCASFASNAGDTDIGNVSLNTLNNGTATPIFSNPTANRTFTDFTALAATNLQRGGNYLLSISQITSGVSFFNSSGVAYIDFNQDGVFGFGESFTIGGTLSSASLYTISNYITVPTTASLGNTRMRVILSEGSAAGSCATYNYGETEDYTVNIQLAQSCPSPFLGGNAVANLSSVCPGTPVNLSLSGNSVAHCNLQLGIFL
jgi:GEVED domain